ncbi:hypothetical protein D3C71_1876510 [compost metagenome]|uniref:hypothetical protein n=1 Tax=Pseudomonas sp. PONIH3 TaxID=1636610 RepID=UPI000F9549F4
MSIAKIQERLDLIDRMRKGGESLDPAFSERDVRSLLAEIDRLKDENERFRRYSEQLQADKKVLAETRVLYTWLRKKCDEPSNDVVAVYMNIGHDWAKVTDLDRDLRSMIEREEP